MTFNAKGLMSATQIDASDIETINTGIKYLYQNLSNVMSHTRNRDQSFIRQAIVVCEQFRNARTHNDYSGCDFISLTAAVSSLYIWLNTVHKFRQEESISIQKAYSICLNRAYL